MAGSLAHIVDDDTGKFTMDLIDNLGDAHEALEECFNLINSLSGGVMEEVNLHCKNHRYLEIEHSMVES